MSDNIVESAPDHRATFRRWLADGATWIGVFENHALDSATAGARIALPYDDSHFDRAEVGRMRAPDTRAGTGWKYILIAKTRDVEEAQALMESRHHEQH